MENKEKQLNLLLPITTSRLSDSNSKSYSTNNASYTAKAEDRYSKVRESLRNKGLIKAR